MQTRNPVKAKEIRQIAHVEIKMLQDPRTVKRMLLGQLLSAKKELNALNEQLAVEKDWLTKKDIDSDITLQEFKLENMRERAAGIFGGRGPLAVIEKKFGGIKKIRSAKKAVPEVKLQPKEEIKIKTAAEPKPDENAIFLSLNLPPREKLIQITGIEGSLLAREAELSGIYNKKGWQKEEAKRIKKRLEDIHYMRMKLQKTL